MSEDIMHGFLEDFKVKFDEFKSQNFSDEFNREVTLLGQSYGLMIQTLTSQDDAKARNRKNYERQKSLSVDDAQNRFREEIQEFLDFMVVPGANFDLKTQVDNFQKFKGGAVSEF